MLADGRLEGVVLRRARHVVSEDERTLRFAALLREGRAPGLGPLLDASHASLRDDFEVSSPALDVMAECARADPACHGARMTGAGFGGCAVALVKEAEGPAFLSRVLAEYERRTGVAPKGYLCRASAGASVEPLG
jgi:galactokinase